MQFKIGDKAVYPAHGVGVVRKIESRTIGGLPQDFYVIQIIASGATVMVPVAASTRAGMRRVMSDSQIEGIYTILKSPGRVTQTTWNRRFREFNDKLRTGSLEEIAEVLRDLRTLRSDKDLSFGEKKMFDKAKSMIVAEISAASAKQESDIEKELDQMLFA